MTRDQTPRVVPLDAYEEEIEAAVQAALRDPQDADYALITDYLAGELSPADRMRVEERLRTDAAFRELAEPLILIWKDRLRLAPDPDLLRKESERTLQGVRKRIDLYKRGIHTPTIEEKRAKKRRRRRSLFTLIGALITTWAGVWLRPQLFPAPSVYVHADAPQDFQRSARLPDESQVTLAPGSHLSYSTWFTRNDERELTLNGEGTFAVARGARRPLTLHTAGIELTASNAHFIVHAYDAEPTAYVIVQDGSVEVRAQTVYGSTKPLTLRAGQVARVGPGLQIIPVDSPFPLHR